MKKAFRIGISIVICVGLVCGYYYYLSHKNAKSAEDAQDKTTEVEKIIERDFDKKYPRNTTRGREVVQPDHHGFLRRGIYGRGTGERQSGEA